MAFEKPMSYSAESVDTGQIFTCNGTPRRYFNFSDIETLVLIHKSQIEARGYQYIAAIARGGLYAGAMISQFTGISLAVTSFDRAKRSVRSELGAPAHCGQRLLVVDDIAGLGYTLSTTVAHFEQLGWQVDTFVIAWDDLSRLVPTFGRQLKGARPVFPWERGLVSKCLQADRITADEDSWRVGFDLDGVFLDDVPSSLYTQDIEAALRLRDALPAYTHHPPQWCNDGKGLIISARLKSEQAQTQRWLERHGLNAAQVVLRTKISVDPAEHKAAAIVANGVTEFIESEFSQAQEISRLVPYCVVWHYEAMSQQLTRLN